MTRVMSVQLLPFAGLLALVFAWPRLSTPTSHLRLFAEVLIIGVGTSASCAGPGACTGGWSNTGNGRRRMVPVDRGV
jgi:hypothetical protein